MEYFKYFSDFLNTVPQEYTSSVSMAYLDPSTGAMIISAIVGILATLLLTVKIYWFKIIGLFRKKKISSYNNDNQKKE